MPAQRGDWTNNQTRTHFHFAEHQTNCSKIKLDIIHCLWLSFMFFGLVENLALDGMQDGRLISRERPRTMTVLEMEKLTKSTRESKESAKRHVGTLGRFESSDIDWRSLVSQVEHLVAPKNVSQAFRDILHQKLIASLNSKRPVKH